MDARTRYENKIYEKYYLEAIIMGSFTPFQDASSRTHRHMRWADHFICYEHECAHVWDGAGYSCAECKK